MKSSSPNSTDMAQFFSTANHSAVSIRSNSNSQRNFGIGLGFNSPKNDTQKTITLSTRVTNEIPRYVPSNSKTTGILDRKSSRTTPDATPKANYMSSSLVVKAEPNSAATAASTNSYKTAESRGSSADKRRTTNNASNFSPSKPAPSYQPSSSRALQESLRKELGYGSKVKNLEIDTKNDVVRAPGSVRSQSTKNQEKSPSQSQNFFSGSIKRNIPQQFQGLGSSYKNNTEGNEDRHFMKPSTSHGGLKNSQVLSSHSKLQQQQPLGGSAVFLSATSTRNASKDRESIGSQDGEKERAPVGFSGNRKIGFSSNGQLQYTNLSQGVIKSNNFFSSSATNWAKGMNNKEKSPVKPTNHEDLTRSAVFEKKNAKVQDLRASLRINTDTNETSSNSKLRTPSAKARENSQPKETKEKDDNGSAQTQKTGLDSFITKVGRGVDPLSNMRKSLGGGLETKSTRNQNRPVLAFDDKANQPNQGSNSVREQPKSTKNSDSKISTYSYNRLFQQATANQEQSKKTTKPSKPSTPTSKSRTEQKDNEISPTSPFADEKKPFIYFMTSLERFHREYDQSNYFCQIYREHFMQTFQAMVFCRYLKPVDHKVLTLKKVTLPRKDIHKDKKTLIFDLDETLIHCNESTSVPSDVVLPIKFPHGEVIEAGINVRPYALDILKELSQYYELVVFTASHSSYANVVLDYIDPQGYIQHRLYREHCMPTEEGVYIKDLRVIGNRNMQDMILVDNAAYSFGYQIENGIPIVPFYDNKTDQELKHLIPYLKFLSAAKDPREINKLTFKLHSYSQYSSPSQVLDNLIFQE